MIEKWGELLKYSYTFSFLQKLKEVNKFFNYNIDYVSDEENWESKEYWATLFETMEKEKGDCDDYAFAKYFTLKIMGVKEEILRLLHVVTDEGVHHMVLGIHIPQNDDFLILDNITPHIEPLSERTDLTLIYSFNGDNMWSNDNKLIGNSYRRMKMWRELFERFRVEYEEYTAPFEF